MTPRAPTRARAMAVFAAAFAVLVGALGFSRAAPWIGSMLRGESCPFAGSSPDREQLERHRRQSLALRRGPRPAVAQCGWLDPAKPAINPATA